MPGHQAERERESRETPDEPQHVLRMRDRLHGVKRRRGVGYQTLINEVLAEHVRKDVA